MQRKKLLVMVIILLLLAGTASLWAEGLKVAVPVITIDYKTSDDSMVITDLFTRLTVRGDIYYCVIIPIQNQIQSIINHVPERNHPRICILFSGTRYVKVETENTITGSICA